MDGERTPNPLLDELVPGERTVWQGKPCKWPFITMGTVRLLVFVPFSLAWGGFFAYLEALMIHERSLAGALLVTPFLAIGLYLVGGRFWAGARCWKNTWYMITNKRVLMRLGTVRPKVVSVDLSMITSIHLQAHRGGVGHINVNSGTHHVFDSIYIWQPGPSWAISGGLS